MCLTIESSLPLPPLLCSALRLPAPVSQKTLLRAIPRRSHRLLLPLLLLLLPGAREGARLLCDCG